MKLKKYRVENFRSVKDSGWINCEDVTTLVGINEAGKSNLLLALWKLNPASGGDIKELEDMPVKALTLLRKEPENVKFITATFVLEESDISEISEVLSCNFKSSELTVSRYYDGSYSFDFGDSKLKRSVTKTYKNDEGEEFAKTEEEEIPEEDIESAILNIIPKFVYYSNYGNLSTRLYLPNVIRWLKGERVEGIDISEDQVRTLRVLFSYVDLSPDEILELGKDPKDLAIKRSGSRTPVPEPTEEEIKQAQESKDKRAVLLQSASTRLTDEFNKWWKQGNYKFRFFADGDYFTILVSDSVRTEEVSLSLRSTGLQWFLSFYLIFLVESGENHKNAILLLDEAGLTLHPLAQKDLADFFSGLSKTNQIIHTTHSPFIIDTDNIDRCKVVYMNKEGYTVASDNLRQSDDKASDKSIYAVHAALGLSVSNVLLEGCKPVIVEGVSDQIYLNGIKQALIANKKISPSHEIVFIPTGGVRGIQPVTALLGGRKQELPFVIVDSDTSGIKLKKSLTSNLYQGDANKVIEIKDVIDLEYSEIEDLIPYKSIFMRPIEKLFNPHNLEEEFEDIYEKGKPIIPQIETFASNNGVQLQEGWKVELAKIAKKKILSEEIDSQTLDIWTKLFEKFI